MASILNCSIKANLLLAAGLSCFSLGRAQSIPVSLHDPLLRISVLPARVSTQKAQLKTVVDACIANGIYAIIDWHSMENAQAAADPTMSSAHITYAVHLYAATHKQSFRNCRATDALRRRDMAFDLPPTFADEARADLRHGGRLEQDT